MSPSPQTPRPGSKSWPMAAAFAGWTALAGFVTYSYADAAPTKPTTVVAAERTTAAPVAAAALNHANQLSDAFASVAESVSPSVVRISVEAKQDVPDMFRFFGGPQGESPRNSVKGAGSGVVFTADGNILTNNHVVEHATRINVSFKDGRSFRAKVVGSDPAVDLAVLKIDAKNLPVATFGDSGKARVGEWVLAIGAPFGLDYTLTAGVLSAKGRGIGANEIEDYLQTDASINPGNSGGPLVNLHGHVLGINTVIIGGSGIGFAIPSNLARNVGEQLIAKGRVSRAWIGVSFQELTPELSQGLGKTDTHGALVSSVVAKGPAANAGIRPGDVIEKVDADPVVQGKDLLRSVLLKPVGSEVTLAVRRDGKVQTMKLKTGERPGDMRAEAASGREKGTQPEGALGLNLQQLTPQIASELDYKGSGKVVVAGVRPGSPAASGGIERGDVIVEADKKTVQSPSDIADAAKDGKVMLRVERKSGSFFTVLSKED